MEDPEKEEFILNAVEKIKSLRKKVEAARKNNEDMSEIMQDVQAEVKGIKSESEDIFDSNNLEMSPDELEAYLQNPSNFSEEDWQLLETIKEETNLCKKEIVKSNEDEAVGDLIGRKKGKTGLSKKRKKRWNGPKYI